MRPLLQRSSSAAASFLEVPVGRRPKKTGMPKDHPLSSHSGHEHLHLAKVRDINWLRVCEEKEQPYYFFSKWGDYARPLSSRLQLAYHYDTAPNKLGDLQKLLADHEEYRLSYLDPTLNRVYRLDYGLYYQNDPSLCAALSCLVRVGPLCTNDCTDAELVSITIAAACFQMGFLVRRNSGISDALKARIATSDTGRALELASKYCALHGLQEVQAYLTDTALFFDDRDITEAPVRTSYLDYQQWPKLAVSFLFWVFRDQPHDP